MTGKEVLDEIIESVEHEVEEVEHYLIRFFKKFSLIFLGIFLVLLMVSYIFVSYPLSGIIRGQLESTPLDNGIIEVVDENLQIIFNQQTLDQLTEIYLNEQEVEFSVCLSGQMINESDLDVYYLDSLYVPEMYEQTFNHVRFKSCPVETLVMLHSHPYKSCLASETDINTLESSKSGNSDLLMVVMCEPGRFSVYR